jgi:hypothetical protein
VELELKSNGKHCARQSKILKAEHVRTIKARRNDVLGRGKRKGERSRGNCYFIYAE